MSLSTNAARSISKPKPHTHLATAEDLLGGPERKQIRRAVTRLFEAASGEKVLQRKTGWQIGENAEFSPRVRVKGDRMILSTLKGNMSVPIKHGTPTEAGFRSAALKLYAKLDA